MHTKQPDGAATRATLAEVLEALKADGWKVTKTSLYRHHGEGKIRPQPDGTYHDRDVAKYARTWLKQVATGKRVNELAEDLQRKKLTMELENLELENARKRIALERDQERYIPREQMDIELAARAGILEAGLKQWVQAQAAEWIRLAGGDPNRAGELINRMSRDLDEHINGYASPREYEIVIDAGDDTEGGEE